ncbi:DUF3857 domain-containing protein [Flavobacteriaceae bacterium Ap0902]|nr:DUF3857 domain-containing protein [Flavobacteriaceae bacterium Ap0902]
MRSYISILFLFIFIFSFSQVKFGKVSKEELSATSSSIEEGAVAEFISKEASYDVKYIPIEEEFRVIKNIKVRIKVYDKDKASDKFLNVKIPLYILDNDREKASGIKAYTYNLVDGKIEKTKVEKSNIFKEKKNDYLIYEKFAFPNVKNGSVLEYKYTIDTPRFFDLDTWYFQEEIPIRYNRFIVFYPEFFVYNRDIRGEYIEKVNTSIQNTGSQFQVEVNEVVHKNVPALKKEPFVLNSNNLRASIHYELKEYINPGIGYKNFSSDWPTVIKNLKKDMRYADELKGNGFLDEEVSNFDGISNQKEKMNAIFNFVKEQYTWNGYDGLYPAEGVRKTYKNKTGNGTDLNFVLISMLNKANIKAHPIVLSTVDNGILNYNASRLKLNHTITGAYINNELYLMDPKDKFSRINLLPLNDLNFQGFMMLEDGTYREVNLTNQLPSEIKTTLIYSIEDGLITGNMTQVKTNYYALSDLKSKANDEDNFEHKIVSEFDVDVSSFKMQESIKQAALQYRLSFEDDKSVEEIGNKLFIQPLLFLKEESNLFNFRNAERKYPLEFGTPFTQLTTVKIAIPSGYDLDVLPEDFKTILPNNVGGYNITFKEDKDYIIIQALLYMGNSVLPADYYVSVKDMYQQMIEKENEQLIFKQL